MKKNRKVSVPRGSQIKMSREEKLYQACIAIVVGFVTVACIILISHSYLSPSFKFATAFKSHPCLVPF